MADKKDMQVDGGGTEPQAPDENGEFASRRDSHTPGGASNPGESGGGHYPNPHDGSNDQEPPEDLDERREVAE